jgi:hypothetical protein
MMSYQLSMDPPRLGESGRWRKIASHYRPQQPTQLCGTPAPEHALKARLRDSPSFARRLQSFLTGFGQAKRLGAVVGGIRFDLDQSISLQRQDVASKRRAVHHHVGGERVDGQRSLAA